VSISVAPGPVCGTQRIPSTMPRACGLFRVKHPLWAVPDTSRVQTAYSSYCGLGRSSYISGGRLR